MQLVTSVKVLVLLEWTEEMGEGGDRECVLLVTLQEL